MVGIEITNFDEVLNQAIKTQQELEKKASISELNIEVDNNESSVDDLSVNIQLDSTQDSVHSETETEVLPTEGVVSKKLEIETLSTDDNDIEYLSNWVSEITRRDVQSTIDTPGKKGIYQITGDVELTLAVDSVIHSTRKDDWARNRFKERELRQAIGKVVEDKQVSSEILDTIKNYPEYTQQSVHSNLEADDLESEGLSAEEIVSDELESEGLSAEEIVSDELESEILSTKDIVSDELESEILLTEEIVSDELESESLSTKEIVSDELESESLSTDNEDLLSEKQLSVFNRYEEITREEITRSASYSTEEYQTSEEWELRQIIREVAQKDNVSIEIIETTDIENYQGLPTKADSLQQLSFFDFEEEEKISIQEKISEIELKQQRVEYVASVTEDLLKYVGENYYEGSEHIAYKDEETNTLSITTLDHQLLMSAQFNLSTNKWENIDSNLSENDISHFQTVQAIITKRIEDRNNRIQQQEFVERLAPLIADYHDLTLDEDHKFGGYNTQWDSDNKVLILTDNQEQILRAKLNQNSWENIDSSLDNWQVDELENYLMSSLDINTEKLQKKRFEKVQPVVADILRHYKSNHFEGKHYSAEWVSDSKQLTAWQNNDTRQPFLSAQWSKEGGWQDTSDYPISFEVAHHFTENIKPVLERHQQRQQVGIER